MNKGIVMELKGKTLIVLTPDGAFEEIPRLNRTCQVGEEILYAAARRGRISGKVAAYSSLVAAVILAIMLFSGLPGMLENKQVVAYISIDINPSFEIGVDGKQRVRELRSLNADAQELIHGLGYGGKPLHTVTEELLKRAEAGYLSKEEADIVISSTSVSANAPVDEGVLSVRMKELVAQYVRQEHPAGVGAIAVTSFPTPKEVREAAIGEGLSPGKYVVYLNAKNNGVDVKLEEMKKQSVHSIAKEAGGIDQLLVNPDKITGNSIRELLREEKSGELDRKMKDKKDKKAADDAKKQPKATKKPTPTPAKPVLNPTSPTVRPPGVPTPGRFAEPGKPSTKPKDEDKDDEKKRNDEIKSDDRKRNDEDNSSKKDNGGGSNRGDQNNDDGQRNDQRNDRKNDNRKDQGNDNGNDQKHDNRNDQRNDNGKEQRGDNNNHDNKSGDSKSDDRRGRQNGRDE